MAEPVRTPETRFLALPAAQIRAVTDDGKRLITGKAVVYNTLSLDLGDFREKFLPGAFTEALASGADVRALIDHNPSLIIGRNKAGTLRLNDTPEALEFEIDVPACDYGDALLVSVARGDKDGMSFRFYCLTQDWGLEDGSAVRTVAKADIDDVSVVTYPAYVDTTAAVRSLDQFRRGQSRRSLALNRELRRLRLAEAD